MKNFAKKLSLILVCVFFLNTTAFAAETNMGRSSSYIMGSHAGIQAERNGTLVISFHVSSFSVVSEIGAISIEIYEDNGHTTRCVATYNSSDANYSGMIATDRSIHSGSVTYSGTAGYEYYAKAYLTANDHKGGDTVIETSTTVLAKK